MGRILSAVMFFPRGGSATVVRALARRLPRQGWETTVLSGSLPGHGDAEHYYEGVDVHPVHFTDDAPMHPSYEDPDFGRLGEEELDRHASAWAEQFEAADAAHCDVLHLHHLTPLNEAAGRVAPDVPVVAHLHGTELLALERIPEDAVWARRMRGWAQAAERIVVPSEAQLPRVESLLGVRRDRCVVLPNGVDLELFDRCAVDRRALWRRHLAEEPKGWEPGGEEGSIAYGAEEADRVAAGTVVLYVGRFTEVKRLSLLIAAWSRAQESFTCPASLAIVGGHPGEWEGEHPIETIRATGARDVYLAGWHPQERLPGLLAASDALVLPSVREQFGLVVVEAMACGIPPIAVDRFGPSGIVDHGRTGWLVEPDDEASLAAALAEAVNDGDQRRARGNAAYDTAREHYGWDTIAERLACVFEDVADVPALAA